MKLKEIEQVEIFPPTTYFHFHNSRKISLPQKNSFALCTTDFGLPFILQ